MFLKPFGPYLANANKCTYLIHDMTNCPVGKGVEESQDEKRNGGWPDKRGKTNMERRRGEKTQNGARRKKCDAKIDEVRTEMLLLSRKEGEKTSRTFPFSCTTKEDNKTGSKVALFRKLSDKYLAPLEKKNHQQFIFRLSVCGPEKK